MKEIHEPPKLEEILEEFRDPESGKVFLSPEDARGILPEATPMLEDIRIVALRIIAGSESIEDGYDLDEVKKAIENIQNRGSRSSNPIHPEI